MKYAIAIAGALSLALVGCDRNVRHDDHGRMGHAGPRPLMMTTLAEATEAVAVLHPLGDSKVHGTVRFSQSGGRMRVVAEVRGLQPNGTHGFHIHEFGDCSAPDGTSAGGHYDPEGHPHAGPDADKRHAGDFGNLKADASGNARLELTVDNITIAGQRNPIIGRAVIVHEKADDLKSQPTGDAGGRVACDIIGIAKSQKPATQPQNPSR